MVVISNQQDLQCHFQRQGIERLQLSIVPDMQNLSPFDISICARISASPTSPIMYFHELSFQIIYLIQLPRKKREKGMGWGWGELADCVPHWRMSLSRWTPCRPLTYGNHRFCLRSNLPHEGCTLRKHVRNAGLRRLQMVYPTCLSVGLHVDTEPSAWQRGVHVVSLQLVVPPNGHNLKLTHVRRSGPSWHWDKGHFPWPDRSYCNQPC